MEPTISALLEEACAISGVQTERLQTNLISRPAGGAYVLYWMQRAQRAIDNPAFELGLALAGQLRLPLLTVFVLTDYPEAVKPHYRFMLEGLAETASQLRDRGIGFAILQGDPAEMVAHLCRDAAVLLCDAGRLQIERSWRSRLASILSDILIITVETEAVVPPALACPKPAWSAAVLRTRIAAFLPHFLAPSPEPQHARIDGTALGKAGDDRLFTAWTTMPDPPSSDMLRFQRIAIPSGTAAALKRFADFLANDLTRYSQERNDPNAGAESGMSPYLHFGQVSPVTLARMALATGLLQAQDYVEQLVVRRELAANFVLYVDGYDTYAGAVPDWARSTLAATPRTTLYSPETLEHAQTDDPVWNAAQLEMVLTGKMHNYLRMYWGKRLLAWHGDPATAFALALRLNNRYSLDGRDPNGFAGVAWCFGRHDRPWPRKPLFGMVRSMTPEGLARKFDIQDYTRRIGLLYNQRIREAP